MNPQRIVQSKQVNAGTPSGGYVLRRKCNCGNHTASGGQCSTCATKKPPPQRRSAADLDGSRAPDNVMEVLRSSGQPLEPATRAYMEPRFAHDFSDVRVHTDPRAAESARHVGAVAYAAGRNVVFGAGQYSPGTHEGRLTLAHELAHVVQQQGRSTIWQAKRAAETLAIGPSRDAAEQEAESVAQAVTKISAVDLANGKSAVGLAKSNAPMLRRRLVVNATDVIPVPPGQTGRPTPLTVAVEGLLADTCPDGGCRVDTGTGNVTTKGKFCEWHPPFLPDVLEADSSSTPAGCRCICDVINGAETTTIAFGAGGPGTTPGSVVGAGPGQGGTPTSPTVSIDPRFHGQYKINSRWVDVPFHLLLAHELCGHALPKMRGTHVARGAKPPGGTAPQEQPAVDVERGIAAEHNPPLPRRPDDYSGAARQRP